MKELIPIDDCGMFVSKADEEVRVSSRHIAKIFGKEHKNVLHAIDKITKSDGISKEFARLNFKPSAYKSKDGRTLREYCLTRDGFVMVTMGFTGDKAMKFKEWYITRFNEMETQLMALITARLECPELTDALKRLNTENPFIYSNEFNMIHKMVLGMGTADFRKIHDIKKGESIRPYLTKEQIELIQKLQKYDSVLVDVLPNYEDRKNALLKFYNSIA